MLSQIKSRFASPLNVYKKLLVSSQLNFNDVHNLILFFENIFSRVSGSGAKAKSTTQTVPQPKTFSEFSANNKRYKVESGKLSRVHKQKHEKPWRFNDKLFIRIPKNRAESY